ncbi:auxin-induced protein 22D-like [Typha angustifolia]|uniref:auxin-induced protein 22D-like n=1 Tax=Typha angustifolia TaxID=59011 RepID=UPI003C2AB1C1
MEGPSSYVNDVDNLKATELRLGLPGTDAPEKPTLLASRSNKRALPESNGESRATTGSPETMNDAPVAKAQVVGWPPIRSYRKNSFQAKKAEEATGMYVKVSMDGAPYLRKIDLKVYKGYKELREGLDGMFMCFSGMDGCPASEFAITYEDKDGDLMLVGDVPWGMFINSCKRLRIMRGSEARGLGSNP